ncbi:unnamed protein product [Effrenium voratum]|nr:unnamed protein product [Effrenium voratum]
MAPASLGVTIATRLTFVAFAECSLASSLKDDLLQSKSKNMVETISAAYADSSALEKVRAALTRLQEVCSDPSVVQHWDLEAGEAYLVDNYRWLHARTHFEDDASRRLFFRIWLQVKEQEEHNVQKELRGPRLRARLDGAEQLCLCLDAPRRRRAHGDSVARQLRGHERLMLRERDRKSCARDPGEPDGSLRDEQEAEVPRLRLESDRSSSSGFTSRSELEPPPQSREVQDLCREMEAMRHVIQKDLAEMQGTWVQLKEALEALAASAFCGARCGTEALRRGARRKVMPVQKASSDEEDEAVIDRCATVEASDTAEQQKLQEVRMIQKEQWSKPRGVVPAPELLKQEEKEEEEDKEQWGLLEKSFSGTAGQKGPDHHLEAYLNERLFNQNKEPEPEKEKTREEALYEVPSQLQVPDAAASQVDKMSWVAGLAEVALPVEYKLKNIEATERAKREYLYGESANAKPGAVIETDAVTRKAFGSRFGLFPLVPSCGKHLKVAKLWTAEVTWIAAQRSSNPACFAALLES